MAYGELDFYQKAATSYAHVALCQQFGRQSYVEQKLDPRDSLKPAPFA